MLRHGGNSMGKKPLQHHKAQKVCCAQNMRKTDDSAVSYHRTLWLSDSVVSLHDYQVEF